MSSAVSHISQLVFDERPIWNCGEQKDGLTDELEKHYNRIAEHHVQQKQVWSSMERGILTQSYKFLTSKYLSDLGFCIDWEEGHLKYADTFQPVKLTYDVCYIRHGKTHGNTEPRIFQGCVDYISNQLNSIGKQQAVESADKMENLLQSKEFVPDLILMSPLRRAIETAEPFRVKHPEIRGEVMDDLREQQYGEWDGRIVSSFPDTHPCHLNYIDQNVVVKTNKPHVRADGVALAPENFLDMLVRQHLCAKAIEDHEIIKKMADSRQRAKVLIYGHSMAGAAWQALTGHGRSADAKLDYIGFDGPCVMPHGTPCILSTPAAK